MSVSGRSSLDMPRPSKSNAGKQTPGSSPTVCLVYRDVTPELCEVVGAEINLTALDAWKPGQASSVFSSGFRVLHTWSPGELVRRVHPSAGPDQFLPGPERERFQLEAENALLEPVLAEASTASVRYLDQLHLCAQTWRWWTTPVEAAVRHVVAAVAQPTRETIDRVRRACAHPGRAFSGLGYTQRGLMLAPQPFSGVEAPDDPVDAQRVRQATWVDARSADFGYWNLTHAGMRAGEFVHTFASSDPALAKAALALISYKIGTNVAPGQPVAHTRLLFDPGEWVRTWMRRGDPSELAQLDSLVERLKALLRKNGLRPWSQCPPPLLPASQPLRGLAPILTDEMVDAAAVEDLATLGIHTLKELSTASLETLLRFSPLRSDLLRAEQTLRAFGYALSELAQPKAAPLELKRTFTYTTDDGRKFATRREAAAHEILLKRRERLREVLTTVPGFADKIEPAMQEALLDGIAKNRDAMVTALSDRAIRRMLRKGRTGQKRH